MLCCLLEILRVADRRDGSVEVAGDFVADVLGAVFFFLYCWRTEKFGMLEARVGDGVGAEMLAEPFELRSKTSGAAISRVFARSGDFDDAPLRGRLPLELSFGIGFLLDCHETCAERDVLMVSRDGCGARQMSAASRLRDSAVRAAHALCPESLVFVKLAEFSLAACIGTPTVRPSRASRVSTQSIWL